MDEPIELTTEDIDPNSLAQHAATQPPPELVGEDIDPDSLPEGVLPQQPAFKTPSGSIYMPGQIVKHSSGAEGTVIAQHPDTKKAVIEWRTIPVTMKGKDGKTYTGMSVGRHPISGKHVVLWDKGRK